MMTEQNPQERLRTAIGKTAFKLTKEREAMRFRTDPSPCPGDLFVFREATDIPVEWVIVERDPADARRLRVVPVDDYPQVGSPDVKLHLDEPERVATVRCDLDTWLDASRFEAKLRTGTLVVDDLDRVRRKCAEVASGTLTSSMPEEEVDGDPEYRRWKDRKLRHALSALPSIAVANATAPSVKRHLALAATILLTVTCGFIWERHRLMGRLGEESAKALVENRKAADLKGELEEQAATSERELRELRERYQNSGETIRGLEQERDRERREAALLRQRLDAAQSSTAHPNLPVFFLKYDDVKRGDEYEILLPADATRTALILEVATPEPFRRYRLRILDRDTDQEVWKTDDLLRAGSALTLSLSTSLLTPGRYELLIYGLKDGEWMFLEDEGYGLRVARASRR